MQVWVELDALLRGLARLAGGSAMPSPSQLLGLLPDPPQPHGWPEEFALGRIADELRKHAAKRRGRAQPLDAPQTADAQLGPEPYSAPRASQRWRLEPSLRWATRRPAQTSTQRASRPIPAPSHPRAADGLPAPTPTLPSSRACARVLPAPPPRTAPLVPDMAADPRGGRSMVKRGAMAGHQGLLRLHRKDCGCPPHACCSVRVPPTPP